MLWLDTILVIARVPLLQSKHCNLFDDIFEMTFEDNIEVRIYGKFQILQQIQRPSEVNYHLFVAVHNEPLCFINDAGACSCLISFFFIAKLAFDVLKFILSTQGLLELVYQENQIFNFNEASGLWIIGFPNVEQFLEVLTRNDSSMLFIGRGEAFKDNSDEQIQHHHLYNHYEQGKVHE